MEIPDLEKLHTDFSDYRAEKDSRLKEIMKEDLIRECSKYKDTAVLLELKIVDTKMEILERLHFAIEQNCKKNTWDAFRWFENNVASIIADTVLTAKRGGVKTRRKR